MKCPIISGIEYLDELNWEVRDDSYSIKRSKLSDTLTSSNISTQVHNHSHCTPGFYFKHGVCQGT